MPDPGGSTRALRIGGYLAILFGVFGTLTGIAAAATFIPYRNASTFAPSLAELFTVIAALGAVASVVAVIAGWGLLRTRRWAWNLAVGTAAAAVTLNAVMAGLWPGYGAFLVVVALAYGILVAVLMAGLQSPRVRAERAAVR